MHLLNLNFICPTLGVHFTCGRFFSSFASLDTISREKEHSDLTDLPEQA